MHLTTLFLTEICKYGEYNYTFEDEKIILIPREDQQYFMPNLIITNVLDFERVLNEYIETIRKTSLSFYRLDSNHQIQDYLFYLIKSLSNDDCQDLISYIKRFIQFLEDKSFSDFNHMKQIGTVSSYDVMARKCEEYYGSETPFTIHYYLEKPGLRIEMPLIRYGISSDKIAYIYSIQRKKIYNNKNCRIKSINTLFNEVNKSIKENRNITPSMLCSLTIFLGMLQSEGINYIKADGFLTRRYGYFEGITEDEKRDLILHNSIDKFFKTFIRLSIQLNNVNISAYPFDIDSYMHIKLEENISSDNILLNDLFNVGKNYKLLKK